MESSVSWEELGEAGEQKVIAAIPTWACYTSDRSDQQADECTPERNVSLSSR